MDGSMEVLAEGELSVVLAAPPRPGLAMPVAVERTRGTLDLLQDEVRQGLLAEVQRLASMGPPFRRVVEVSWSQGQLELVWERLVGVTAQEVMLGLGAEGRVLPLEAWLKLAMLLTSVPDDAPCGPSAGGHLGSVGFDLHRQLQLFPHSQFTLFGRPLEALLPPAPRIGRLEDLLGFQSPEAVRGEPLHPASRVFSVGWALASLLTGDSPFPRETVFETLRAVNEGHVYWDPAVHPDCPPGLGEVLRRALAPEPAGRWHDLRSLRAALLAEAGVEPASEEELALLALGAAWPRLEERLKALEARPRWLPEAWRGGGLRVLADQVLERLRPLESLPARRAGA